MAGETEFTTVRHHGDESKAEALYSGMQPLTPEDIAEAVHWVISLPPHVNVDTMELMPVDQSFAGFQVHRGR